MKYKISHKVGYWLQRDVDLYKKFRARIGKPFKLRYDYENKYYYIETIE